ncbi:HEAT repeat domain-containing protein [Cyclobacterium marinum]|uniref:Heme-binding protein n=1 Tax=Cyclobacterium marinum (strain ATCC 25205 / DSM 745 / LMG 13164 / NCIMB 1802) TaxID=880070 RepID=G0J325_CYCMS|nr:HEAT repeat domain-containing protein [Cyclobacterium marinum]AEL28321.1 heme-binding protein [Cyclobacterium marinum DSM 745]
MKQLTVKYPLFLRFFSIGCFFIFLGCGSKEEQDLKITKFNALETQTWAAELEEQLKPEIDSGLFVKVWASDSMIFDPISIDFDEQGRLYYSRTNRQKNSEHDIRRHQDWEIRSIGLQTIEEKRAFLRDELSPENSHKNEWLKDVNGDGFHDWKDMAVERDHIYRVEDTDGDGLADEYQLVFDELYEEVTDVAGAVMKHGDELFVGAAPDMWRVSEDPKTGLASKKVSISHGYGLHIGFGGHGMSGLEMGPDGRVYWGIGDIGFNGVDQNGIEHKYPNRGVIARSNPDGSDFEIFAMGVRNTHEFVFDDYGNLISVDNDGDHRGESERLVYLVEGSDTGWRINWQFGKYRDPKNNGYKVWMDENMAKPRQDGQAAYFLPPIKNYINGPTGMLYNPGTALGERWKNTFFVAGFSGNPARSGIYAFKLNPKGAGFEMTESKKILGGLLPTGMDFGPNGALYFADWIDGWGTKDNGRVWKLEDSIGVNSQIRKDTEILIKADFKNKDKEDLGNWLGHPDQRVRQKAQFELAKRGSEGLEIFKEKLAANNEELARIHAIWGIAQLARSGEENAGDLLLPLLEDSDSEIRAQAARWLGDIRYTLATNALIPLLKDKAPRVQFFAAEALGRIKAQAAVQPIIGLLANNNDEDVYIRHAGSLALARIGDLSAIAALHNHPSRAVRVAAVVALRRMQAPEVALFLDDQEEYILAEAARAINDDFSIEEALPNLGEILNRRGLSSEPLLRRAINANLRVGNAKSLGLVLDFIGLESAPEEMRIEAIEALSTWDSPSLLDRVTGRFRGEMKRDLQGISAMASDPLMKLTAHTNSEIRKSAVAAIGSLKISDASDKLLSLLKTDKVAAVREAAIKALSNIDSDEIEVALELATTDQDKSVRIAGLAILGELDLSGNTAANLLEKVTLNQTLEERQAAITALGKVDSTYAVPVFIRLLEAMKNKSLPSAVELELSEALETLGNEALLTKYNSIISEMYEGDVMASYNSSLFGGDKIEGRKIFFQNQSAQCMRCHSYDDFGGSAGPRLNGVAKRLSRKELLEALVAPSNKIADGYGAVSLKLNDGKSVSGIVVKESENDIILKIGNEPEKKISKDNIKERTNALSSMPDMKALLTKREIRDLISFLVTLDKEDH